MALTNDRCGIRPDVNAITSKNERLAPPASEAVEIAAYFDRLFPLLQEKYGG
jgi:hypothetical protein